VRDTRVRTGLVALLAALLTCTAGAAGLGRMSVLTSIGQPLVAEFDLSVTREELGSLSARLATADAYQKANLQYNPALAGARLTIETRSGGQPYLKLTSTRPVNEPFIDVLVELTWSSGRLAREYTALLDPPGIPSARPAAPVLSSMPELTPVPTPAPAATPAAPAAQPPAAVSAEPQPQAQPPVAAASEPVTASEPATAPQAATPAAVAAAPAISAPITAAPAPAALAIGSRDYGPIERGETLGKIAKSVMPEGVTLEQMLVALYKANPDAFIRKNLNLVRTGKILRVPDRDEVAAIAQTEAVSEYRTHVSDWNAYRQKVADAAGVVPADGRTAVSGKIATKVEDPAAGGGPKDVVKVSRGEPPGAAAGKGKAGGSADRIRALEEDLVARERALAEANDRIAQLEKTVKDMQRLVELKGGPVATAPKPEAKPAPKPDAKPAPTKPEAVAVAKPEPPKPAPAPAKPEPAKPEAAKPAATPPAEKPLAAAPAPETKKPEQVAAAPTPAPAQKKAAALPPPRPEPGLVDQIMAEPLYLGAGGGAIVLGGLAFWMARRRRSRAAEGESPPIAPTLSQAAAAAAGAAAATGDTAAAPPAEPAATGEDDVDPLAEADVYIQYGRDSQAEEILKEALSRDPRRGDVQLKLLEIYASRKDKSAFGKLASDHHKLTGGTGDSWLKAAAMGYSIDPGNKLYEAGKDAAASTVVPPTGHGTDVDLDLGGGTGTSTDITLDAGSPAAPGTDTGILDIGAADTAQKEGEQASTPLPDFTLEVPAAGSSTPDVALDVAPAPAAAAAPESNVIDFQIELPKIDSGPPTVAKAPAQAAADTGLDFKLEIPDLDLGDQDHDKTQIVPPAAASGEKDGHWYDVQTKFDLAKAYQEMGDKDGAKEILQEVIKEGDAEQKTQAKTLLDSLA
jgi:pilus assembly protein FimV